jgi:D,D-heptose 1,7-bisphosphate phosphatase
VLKEAIVLAGGEATRLGPLAADVPKSLMPVAGRPFVDHLVWNVARFGIRRLVFAVGRHGEKLVEHVGDGSALGVEAVFAREPEPLGTGGALALAAADTAGDEVLVLNGDTLFDLNYLDLSLARRERDAPVAVALRRVPDASRYGAVTLDGTAVASFGEKAGSGPGLVNGGAYVFTRAALDALPEGRWSLETGLLEPLAAQGRLAGRAYEGTFVDIGIPDTLSRAQEIVAAWRCKAAVFLDRDGVLNVDHGHVHDPAGFEWVPGAREAVKLVNDAGLLAIVITNQAGIGRGLYTEDRFLAFSRWVDDRLAEAGAHLDATYHCPHHPTAGTGEYLTECDCRKPAPGMLLEAIRDWDVDAGASVMIGDKPHDLAAARAAGVRGLLFEGGDLEVFVREALG